jgi:hypothetical protein
MQQRIFFLRFKREPASFSLVRFSFSSILFSLRTRFIFSLVSGSLSPWSSIQFLFGFIFRSYQVHFLFGLRFTLSPLSNSVSVWVYFLLGSFQFLFGLRVSFSLDLFYLCTNLIQRKIDRIQRETELRPRENELVNILKSNI